MTSQRSVTPLCFTDEVPIDWSQSALDAHTRAYDQAKREFVEQNGPAESLRDLQTILRRAEAIRRGEPCKL